jgi:hypothetical protein
VHERKKGIANLYKEVTAFVIGAMSPGCVASIMRACHSILSIFLSYDIFSAKHQFAIYTFVYIADWCCHHPYISLFRSSLLRSTLNAMVGIHAYIHCYEPP